MEGIIDRILLSKKSGMEYGFIIDSNGESFYFDSRSLAYEKQMTDFYEGDKVQFTAAMSTGQGKRTAIDVIYIEPESDYIPSDADTKEMPVSASLSDNYYSHGYFRRIDRTRMKKEHLKATSGEYEVLEKLQSILYISHVGHHEMGQGGESFPFCLIGATEFLKQYIHGRYEFLLIFSHFDNCAWQQNTLRAVDFIRKRKEIAERRPLVNFYILVSNANNLKKEIDRLKGGTSAAIIPFSFSEIINCSDKDQLESLILERFSEYLFENNMLGEENPIEDDQLLFGDRGKIADSIVQRCVEGKHSGIFGLRRSGKSSVLRAVMRRLDNADIKYTKIEARTELEGTDSWKTALFDIAKKIRIATSGLKQMEDETRAEYQERLKLNSTEADYEKRPSQSFVEDVMLYTSQEETFIIAIDEIELITYNTATSSVWKSLDAYKGFWGALRDSGCALIVCGVNSTINERSIVEYNGSTCDNPMYERIHNCADFSKTYLPAFTDEQTLYMINTLGSYSNIAFDSVYVEINRAFGGQPYPIRQFCSFMFDRVKKYRSPSSVYEISKPTFSALISEFNNSNKGEQLYNTILQHIVIYKEEYEMLKKIAVSPGKYRKIEHDNLSVIDHLEKYGLVEYDSGTCYISFAMSSIQEYICRSQSKNPQDMTNDERRQYVQEKVYICETKLKKYILNYFTYNGGDSAGKSMLSRYTTGPHPKIMANPKADPVPDFSTCKLRDVFDHKQFVIYFSAIKTLIKGNWQTLGQAIESVGMGKEKFVVCMDSMNAGRTDADHYDPEDYSCPDEWQINDVIMGEFLSSYKAFEAVFEALNL